MLATLAERYVDRCRETSDGEGESKKSAQKFPNLAGFARSLGVGLGVLRELGEKCPEQYGAMLAIFEDEALNAAKNATAINMYIKERLGIGEKCKGDADADPQRIEVVFEHDITEDGL